MNTEIDDSDAKADIFGEFLEALEDAADPESVVHRYASAHPNWARDFVEEAVLSRMLNTSRADSVFPDLRELIDFRIVRWVAAGGMGVVYEAEQISLRRRVALKVRYGHSSPEREERFLREQQTLANLHHSHIVPIHLSGCCGHWQYFVMAFIEGITLHHLIRTANDLVQIGKAVPPFSDLIREAISRQQQLTESSQLTELASRYIAHPILAKRLPATVSGAPEKPVTLPADYFRSAASLMADVADAIEHAHRADVIHRDIKPSNIMVDVRGQCWLIDFGLAHHAGRGEVHSGGTPGYMAPEQVRAEKADADSRTDVWGLGVTLFEMVTLRRPFQGSTPDEIHSSVLSAPLPELDKLVSNIPPDLAAICRKALQKEPASRYQHAADLGADLRRWLAGMPTMARPAHALRSAWMWALRNKGWATALAIGFLGLFAASIFIIVLERSESRQAELRADAAEERVRQEQARAQLQRRESMFHEIQRLRLADGNDGWSGRAWKLVADASQIKADEGLRDLAAATLMALDAKLIRQFNVGASSVGWSDDETRLLIGGLDGPDGRSLEPVRFWRSGPDEPTKYTAWGEGPVAFNVNGAPMQLVFRSPHLVVWDLEKNQAIQHLLIPNAESPNPPTIALGPKGKLAAASRRASNGKAQTTIWDVATGQVAHEFDEPADVVRFSDHDDLLAMSDSRQHRIVVRSLQTKEIVADLSTGNLPIHSLAFGNSHRRPIEAKTPKSSVYLAAGDSGGSIAIWNLPSKFPFTFCRGSPRDIFALSFSPDGTMLASGGREEVRIWDVSSGRPMLRLRPGTGIDYITQLAFSPSGRHLAIGSRGLFYQPSVTVWELDSGRGLQRLLGLSSQIEKIALSNDGKRLAALGQNWEVGLWDVETGRLKTVWEVEPGAFADNAALAFSPDGKQIAFSASNQTSGIARIWDTQTGNELHRWQLPPGLQNHFGFDDANRLWHFQVEIDNGSGLPTSSFDWRQHARICRIRDLKHSDPKRTVAEIRDFNRHVFNAVATPDGKHFIVEGLGGLMGEQRWVKIIASAGGEIVWSRESRSTEKSACLVVDPLGKSLIFNPANGSRALTATIPDGKILGERNDTPIAVNVDPPLRCNHFHINQTGCFLFRDGDLQPILNLALDAMIGCAAFDRTGMRLVWGGRDGSVVICDLREIERRLRQAGLGW